MADGRKIAPGPSGKGNRIILALALEQLAVRGRRGDRERVERALGIGREDESGRGAWLASGSIGKLMSITGFEESAARALGHRLVAPDVIGLGLYRLGLGTPEKTYRRLQAVLARDDERARWTTERVANRRAEIRFQPAPPNPSSTALEARIAKRLCAFRRGQLEAVPGLYGLLPARVKCLECLADGASACRYEVSWSLETARGPGFGLAIGSGVALGLAAGLVFALEPGVRPSGMLFVLGGALSMVTGLSVGWIVDLRRQLEAVAGARRGHLALLDQVDDALAHRLDALARAESELDDAGSTRSPSHRRRVEHEEGAIEIASLGAAQIQTAAQQIHAAAGELECWFEKESSVEASSAGAISPERGLVREIREWASEIASAASPSDAGALTSTTSLVRLVERAFTALRPSLSTHARLICDADEGLQPIECEPLQIEHLVVQLVRNAVDASVGLCTAPEVRVGLRNVGEAERGGVELTVEDRGVGIDSTEVDEVFDPFFGERPAGVSGGLGLPVCLRIVERHGGEMRIESEDRPGTRVTVFLPRQSTEPS